MLQQTQATRVVPFFLHWMKLFPTASALASAPETSVIKAWEGLGYYSRARALHKAAKIIVEQYNGKIPNNDKDLRDLPGIGPYTAGAIRAFAFHERAIAIDANVKRVMMRFLPNMTPKTLEHAVDQLLPLEGSWITMEALIELGALICTPSPSCASCPLNNQCHAFATNTQHLRLNKPAIPRTNLWRDVAVFLHNDQILVTHKTGKQTMSGLYEFPAFETKPDGLPSSSFLHFLQNQIQSPLTHLLSLPSVTHSFTRFHATLYPSLIACGQSFFWPSGQWVSISEVELLPFSSGHGRIRQTIIQGLHQLDIARQA